MSNTSEQVNLSSVPKNTRENIKNLLFFYVERQKNFYRLDSLVTTECSRRCLSNFKSDKLNTDENVCLNSCFQRFYDALEIGETVYDRLRGENLSTRKLSDLMNKL